MRIITTKQLALKATDRWYSQYFKNGNWARHGNDKREIYENLEKLGENPTPKQVNETIGNDSWTRLRCHECKEHVDLVVEVGEEPDYESSTANLCKSCLTSLYELIKEKI